MTLNNPKSDLKKYSDKVDSLNYDQKKEGYRALQG